MITAKECKICKGVAAGCICDLLLICKFMGCKIERKGFNYEVTGGDTPFTKTWVTHLKYNYSWDWLMEVVEKIEQKGVSVVINSDYNIFKNKNFPQTTIEYLKYGEVKHGGASIVGVKFKYHSYTTENKIKSVYQAVVEFIKWYNKQEVEND